MECIEYVPQERDVVKVGKHGQPMSVRQVFPIGRLVIAADISAQHHIIDWQELTPVRTADIPTD